MAMKFVGDCSQPVPQAGDPETVMDQTGHRSVEMVRRYTRRIDAWSKPASSKLGL